MQRMRGLEISRGEEENCGKSKIGLQASACNPIICADLDGRSYCSLTVIVVSRTFPVRLLVISIWALLSPVNWTL